VTRAAASPAGAALHSPPVPDRPLVLIANPVAGGGRGRKALRAACAELERRGARFEATASRSKTHAVELAKAAAEAGAEMVVAVGGDGHVASIAGVLRGTDTNLGVVPAGRGNDLARVLEIPTKPVRALRVSLEGRARPIDVGEVDGSPFLGIASLGFDSEANRIANASRLRGNAVYFYAALRALASWRHARFQVTVDGAEHSFTGYSVAVGNSRAYGGGMMLFPHAELDDGRLDVLFVEEHSRLRALRMMPRVFRGTHVDIPEAVFLAGETVAIRADRPFAVYADGDPIGELPVTVRVGHRQVRVMVPDARVVMTGAG
jgi:YegS/Rv2252/BmrU family lipid kinase